MTTKITEFIPRHFKEVPEVDIETGKKLLLPAIYKGIDNESQNFENLTLEAFRQLFLTTASGKYLIRLGAQEGFTVPQQSGLGVDAFREIVPAVVSYPKQIANTIIRLMSIFYDKSLVSPSFISTQSEPFNFHDKDVLKIRTDKGDLSIGIYEGQVSDLTNVKASEYAGIINAAQSDVFADVSFERENSKTYVRLTSKTYGGGAYIQIIGGTAQNSLKFPSTAATLNGVGTNWIVEKKDGVLWTDITKFTWDGTGVNPNVYLVGVGDFATFRGLSAPFDVFNGTYTVEEVGYDYFVIRNERFQLASAILTEPADNTIVFTVDKRSTIIQNKEYCISNEASESEYSLFVSAVPSVVKRKLRGGGFVHGWQAPVIDFTRDTLTLKRKTMESLPKANNQFILSGDRFRADHRKAYYRTTGVSEIGINAIFTIDSASDNISVLPYTSPTSFSKDNPLYGEIQSTEIKASFGYRHGLLHGEGFTIADLDTTGIISSALINKEQYCKKPLNDHELLFELDYGRTKFTGIDWGGLVDVWQATPSIDQEYDFYLLFPDPVTKAAAGFENGMTFMISFDSGNLIPGKETIGALLSSQKCAVIMQDDLRVYFLAGLGTGSNGKVLDTVNGKRSGWFGGTIGTQFVDKTSASNLRVFANLLCTFQETSTSSNTTYTGPYVYDTAGIITRFVVGNIISSLKSHVLKGDNLLSIDVNDSSSFPLSGNIIFDYGTDSQEGPIGYINITVGQIILDPSYVFQKEHVVGSQVQIIRSIVSPVLHINGQERPFYITGTTAAREFFFTLVRQIVAAGVFVNTEVNYPPLQYVDPSLFPYA
jgi:hypothetical protein